MHPKIGIHPTGTDPANFIHAMPAYLHELGACGLKWVGGFSKNQQRDLPNVTGLQVYNDIETGVPLAVMDCSYLTGLRTAAVSSIAAQRCAIVGAWTQAGGLRLRGEHALAVPHHADSLAAAGAPTRYSRFGHGGAQGSGHGILLW